MSQHDMILDNASGAAFRADLNNALQALASTSKGNARPSTVYAGQLWLDDNTPSATTWSLYLWDGTHDIKVGEFNSTSGNFMPFVGASALSAVYATLASAALTGTPTAPTATAGTNTTQLATTAFVTTAVASSGSAASQAEMEAASSTTKFVSPGRAQYHPGVAKAWVNFNGTGSVAINDSYNVSSITDNGTGDWTVNLSTAFSSANWAAPVSLSPAASNGSPGASLTAVFPLVSDYATSSCRVIARDPGSGAGRIDCAVVTVSCFGDQ